MSPGESAAANKKEAAQDEAVTPVEALHAQMRAAFLAVVRRRHGAAARIMPRAAAPRAPA